MAMAMARAGAMATARVNGRLLHFRNAAVSSSRVRAGEMHPCRFDARAGHLADVNNGPSHSMARTPAMVMAMAADRRGQGHGQEGRPWSGPWPFWQTRWSPLCESWRA